MADGEGAVEVRGAGAVNATANGTVDGVVARGDPDAIVAEIERTRESLARTIDTLADRVSPANSMQRLRERALEQAARPEVRMAAVAVGLVIVGVTILRIWGRRRK